MKSDMVINGFKVTDNAAEVFGSWAETFVPERYVDYLSDMQDLLCRVMILTDEFDAQIKESLINLICIKDDFKKLNTEGGAQ